ncbi:hypothetical protein GWK47_004326 [Chionoecetes opilio]|uniref:Uncharacterized protein n=1 Tax=Chionoecetes opilio TaxID=41210 RepID=A0A8J5CZL9_CHIOP|nr:hypothetical protein GWK47_004326 [Chionoecetes opilio]
MAHLLTLSHCHHTEARTKSHDEGRRSTFIMTLGTGLRHLINRLGSSSPSLRARTALHSPTPVSSQAHPLSGITGQSVASFTSGPSVCQESGEGPGSTNSCSSLASVNSTTTLPLTLLSRTGNY